VFKSYNVYQIFAIKSILILILVITSPYKLTIT